jgi:primosomal protein N' (replication factor Y)
VLTQVAGRAGRSARGGRVIFQTYLPEQYVLQAAAHHDFNGFYERELDYRRQLGYPPFYRLARLETRDRENERAAAAAQALAEQLRHWMEAGERKASSLIGPSQCFFGKINGFYRWQIILRSPDPLAILRGRDLSGWKVEIDPPNLL